MLDSYDQAREKSKSHEVEAYHGKVAEAEFRKWLSGFLPKRYGVTSGYIISQGLSSKEKTPHFDVVIYDQMNAPVLWIEETPDQSSAGRSLAIPAEFVSAVMEVKASFNTTSVDQAIEHLSDLDPLMGGPDHPSERYKLYLPPNFFCAIIFFELRLDSQYSLSAIDKLVSAVRLRGFIGGLILRGEGHSKPVSGRISFFRSETPTKETRGETRTSLLSGGLLTDSLQLSENVHIGSLLMWSELNFSQFAFDTLAIMQGTYQPGYLSSFHGMGTSDHEVF